MDHSEERLLELVITRGHPPELLELIEQPLDMVAFPIALFHKRPRLAAVAPVGDVGEHVTHRPRPSTRCRSAKKRAERQSRVRAAVGAAFPARSWRWRRMRTRLSWSRWFPAKPAMPRCGNRCWSGRSSGCPTVMSWTATEDTPVRPGRLPSLHGRQRRGRPHAPDRLAMDGVIRSSDRQGVEDFIHRAVELGLEVTVSSGGKVLTAKASKHRSAGARRSDSHQGRDSRC